MTTISFVTLFITFFIITDLIPLYKDRQWKAFWTYTVLLSVSYVFNILIVLEVKIPSPAEPIKKIVSGILGML